MASQKMGESGESQRETTERERGVFLGGQTRRRRRVAGGKTERAGGGGESDTEQDGEGETACLNGELREETSCPRRFILLEKKIINVCPRSKYPHSKLN